MSLQRSGKKINPTASSQSFGGSYQDYSRKMAALSKGKQTYTPDDDQPEEKLRRRSGMRHDRIQVYRYPSTRLRHASCQP